MANQSNTNGLGISRGFVNYTSRDYESLLQDFKDNIKNTIWLQKARKIFRRKNNAD